MHHFAFSNNNSSSDIASFLADLAQYLIIEFVPKVDSQVERLRNDKVKQTAAGDLLLKSIVTLCKAGRIARPSCQGESN